MCVYRPHSALIAYFAESKQNVCLPGTLDEAKHWSLMKNKIKTNSILAFRCRCDVPLSFDSKRVITQFRFKTRNFDLSS